MYQIGLFSKINHITTKTLRHYDEIGLLKPDYVEPVTGYRYYTNDQLPKLHRILALRELGLSLGDIKKVIEDPVSIEVFLNMKERELTESIKQETRRLNEVKNWISRIKGENIMNYSPIIKELPAAIIASMRTVVPSYDSYFEVVPKMGEEMKRQGAKCQKPAYCFTIYHDGEYSDKDIDVEICEAVVEAREDSDLVKYRSIEGVPTAVCVLHKGPYRTIGEAYAFLFQWIEENNHEVADNPRESYIDGIWNKDDETEWLTELQIPIKIK